MTEHLPIFRTPPQFLLRPVPLTIRQLVIRVRPRRSERKTADVHRDGLESGALAGRSDWKRRNLALKRKGMPPQSPPKLQHYLPAVYLKQFSPDGQNATRKSSLWRLGDATHVFAKVENQCREPFHYSKTRPEQAENLFHEGEQLYGKALQHIWQGREATKRQYFGLIVMMMSLHLRNPAYENRSGLDNFEVYLGLEESFMSQVLIADSSGGKSRRERRPHFSACWRVIVMKTPDAIFTSDNPAVCCAIDDSRDVHFILLPVTPAFCAIAFDNRFLEIAGPMTMEDLSIIQTLLVGFSLEAVFSHRAFSDEEKRSDWQVPQ